MLAQRFPRSEALPIVVALPVSPSAPIGIRPSDPLHAGPSGLPSTSALSPGRVVTPVPRSKAAPIAAGRFSLTLTMSQETHEKLCYAQSLLSHQVDNLSEVLDRILDLAITQLEKRKFAATNRPRSTTRRSSNPRHIPAHVKRAVWRRDGGRCTYASLEGRRCTERDRLEYDHVEPVARGGGATIENVRLRCRAHNQYGAERVFGTEFMKRKREESLKRPGGRTSSSLQIGSNRRDPDEGAVCGRAPTIS